MKNQESRNAGKGLSKLKVRSIDFAEREVIRCDRRAVRAVEHFAAMRKHGIGAGVHLAKLHVLESEARLTSAVNKLAFECCHLN